MIRGSGAANLNIFSLISGGSFAKHVNVRNSSVVGGAAVLWDRLIWLRCFKLDLARTDIVLCVEILSLM